MASKEFQPNETVWCKGEKCLSPFSGDSRLYQGVIAKICRSPAGQVTAVIKYEGYGKEENEEVEVSKLQKVKDKSSRSPHSKEVAAGSTDSSFFKPLQGSEYDARMKAKYEQEEDDVHVKSERLSGIIFSQQSPDASRAGRQRHKPVVAVGGNVIKVERKQRYKPVASKEADIQRSKAVSPSTPKKYKLDITGGQAKDPQREIKRSPRVSDISSVVDPDKITNAFIKHKQQLDGDKGSKLNVSKNQFAAETGSDGNIYLKHENQSEDAIDQDSRVNTQSFGDLDPADVVKERMKQKETCDSGFEDEELEKPNFGNLADGAKVPYLLSGENDKPIVQVPAPLNQYLRDYQREGIHFLYRHYKENRGAILGDDMGLGKTVQVIGFLSAVLGKQGNRVDVMRQKPSFIRKMSDSVMVKADMISHDPFLIIGPGCVLYNWMDELDTWGYFSVRKFHGSDKKECLAELKKGKVEVVVTTFETFREHQETLNAINWNAVVVDEVHKIKDINSQITKALRTVCTQRRYGLTGTALQNNLLELWALLDWAQPGCLGSRNNFEVEYVQPIEVGQKHDANKRELALARTKKDKFADIRKNMMIRRVKSLIADQLPKKDDNVVFCRLSQLQTSLYRTILEHPSMQLVLHMSDPCPCDSGIEQSKCCLKKSQDGQSVKSLRFTFLHLLLKVSNHVALLIPTDKTSDNQAKHSRNICETALKEHPQFVQQTKEASFKTLSDPKYCGKMKILQGLLKVFSKEHNKILLFSYSTQVLDIVEQYLMGTGHEYRRIDGSVSAKKRLTIVREFNTDPNIFICIISTKAGGLGLNLTGANKVVIFDPNWNPTHDLQAQDRAYRIGQRRNVNVYRLISAGTIEENIYLRQIYKQQLLNVTVEDENARRYFYAIQGDPRQKGELFGIKNMFKLRTGESCLTMDILKRNERVESALSNFDITEYVPPVLHVEEEEEEGSQLTGHEDVELMDSKSSEEDMFAQFFTSQDLTMDEEFGDTTIANLEADPDEQDKTENQNRRKVSNYAKTVKRSQKMEETNELNNIDACEESEKLSKRKTQRTVRFLTPEEESKATIKGGKTRPNESRTGKSPAAKKKRVHVLSDSEEQEEEEIVGVDQTLAGTFQDVADVFKNCGVVHIHENVKVVGGSRAEDHMSKCAINDVYELQQNSQELAVQCEQMEQSVEEDPVAPAGRRQRHQSNDHNTPRSTVVGGAKVLIGQTPKGIKKKQLEDMCRYHKCTSLVDFGELVLGSSLQERIALLNGYYGNQNPALGTTLELKAPAGSGKAASGRMEKGRAQRAGKTVEVKQKVKIKSRNVKFLETSVSLTESENSLEKEVQYVEDDEESSMDVGCKSSTRKRKRLSNPSPARKSHRSKMPSGGRGKGSSYYVKETDSSCIENIDLRNEVHPDRRKETEVVVDEFKETADDLLKKMRSLSENSADLFDTVDGSKPVHTVSADSAVAFRSSSTAANDVKTKAANSRLDRNDTSTTKNARYVTNKEDMRRDLNSLDTSVIDDLLGEIEKAKKPAPYRKKSGAIIESKKVRKTDTDTFKLVDDLFGSKSKGEDDDNDEPLLEVSTLKDDHFDVFADPKMWKTRKKNVSERKRSAVDQLIEDSDADFNSLFTSGKLRKVQKDTGHSKKSPDTGLHNRSTGCDGNNQSVEQEQALGTPSLFSY